nr:hypothetical protein [Tanacetum cinerariifolium]
SKKGRKIDDLNADEDITLVNAQDDAEMFDVTDLHSEEVFVDKDDADKEVNAACELNATSIATTVNVDCELNATSIATNVSAAATIITEEVTLAKALTELKALKPKVKGVFIQEPSESITTKTKTISSKKSQDNEVFVDKDDDDKEVNDEVQKVVEEVVEDINTTKLIVDAAQVNATGELNAASIATTISVAATITTKEVTLVKALDELKALKPKATGVFIQEPSESITTTTISSKKSQDKGKAIMVEEPVKPKKKDRIRLDKEAALKLQDELQEEFEEEQRLAREKDQKELEAFIALIEIWDDVQAQIDADYQLAERLQAEEQQELTDEEKDTLFMQLLEKKESSLQQKEQKKREINHQNKLNKEKYTYLKNMEGKKLIRSFAT